VRLVLSAVGQPPADAMPPEPEPEPQYAPEPENDSESEEADAEEGAEAL
jgi:hypothetical protein